MANNQEFGEEEDCKLSRKSGGSPMDDHGDSSEELSFEDVNNSKYLKEELLDDSILNDLLLPETNLPEKILFVIDTVREKVCTPFELGCGEKFSPFQMMRRVIQIFIQTKMSFNPRHEYSFITMDRYSADVTCRFTNNMKELMNTLERMSEVIVDDPLPEYNLTPCFDLISEYFPVEPDFITRIILVYGRSNAMPTFADESSLISLLEEQNLFLDSIYIHESVNEDNSCEEIYSELNKLDKKNNSYILEVGRNATKLHNTMAQLLAHPLIRPKQNEADYNSFLKKKSLDSSISV